MHSSRRMSESADLPDELFQRKQTKADLDRVVAGIESHVPERPFLRYAEHLKFREIADALQEPIDTIKSKHRRALIQLRKMLTEAPKATSESYSEGN